MKGASRIQNRQITPISELAIPIDLIVKTAMNVSLNAGKEIQEMQIISIIPESIATDEILKMAIKVLPKLTQDIFFAHLREL